jgi:hypothetical protein
MLGHEGEGRLRVRDRVVWKCLFWSGHSTVQRIETSSTIYTFDGKILTSEVKGGRQMSLDDAVENAEARARLNLPGKVPILLDIRALEDMSLEAIAATVNAKDLYSFTAGALVMSSTMHELIAREGRRFRKASIPSRAFTSRDEAERWLLGERN